MKNSSKPHPQAERPAYLLKRAQHSLRINMDRTLKPVGLTTPQYAVLSAIEQDPGVSNASIARGVFVTAQSMVGLVVNLEQIGLIQRTDDPAHGRIKRTELTLKGARLLAEAHDLLRDVDDEMMQGFSSKDRDTFQRLLQKCIENLDVRRTQG